MKNERMLRAFMRNSFTRLRDTVPDLNGNNKASKIKILIGAYRYIKLLEQEWYSLDQRMDVQKQINKKLKEKKKSLQNAIVNKK